MTRSPGVTVTEYPVTAEPPSLAGGCHEIVAVDELPEPVTVIGLMGTVRGVSTFVGSDGREFPAALVAVTVNVYPAPFVKPIKVHDNKPAVVHVFPPGKADTV